MLTDTSLIDDVRLEDIIRMKIIDYNMDHGIVDDSVTISDKKKDEIDIANKALSKRIDDTRNIYRDGKRAEISLLQSMGIGQEELENMSDDEIIALSSKFSTNQESIMGNLNVSIERDQYRKKNKKKKKGKKKGKFKTSIDLSQFDHIVNASEDSDLGKGEYVPVISLAAGRMMQDDNNEVSPYDSYDNDSNWGY